MHHERCDGSGYPLGLKSERIDEYAKIVAIADVYDALASNRVYKRKWSTEDIVTYIKENSGKHFDPEIAEIVLTIPDVIDAIQKRFLDKE